MIAALTVAVSLTSSVWQHWQASRPIVTANVHATRLVRFAIPTDVYGEADPGLADLRVIDVNGKEIPFAVDQRKGTTSVDWMFTPLSEEGFVPGQYSQAVADAGKGGSLHNSLKIDTSADEFSAWVEVAASDDEKTWRIVRDRAPIFRFSSDNLQGLLTVGFSATRARWLRVRVLNGAAEIPITECSLANNVIITPELVPVASGIGYLPGAPAQQTWLGKDFGFPNIPVSAIRVDGARGEFHRTIQVSASDDGETWNDVGQGEIYRDPRAGTSLSVEFPESRGRYWRVAIYNRSDQPLGAVRATLLATPRYVAFRAEPGRRYRLLYRNGEASTPAYDFAALTTVEERERAILVSLGPGTPIVQPKIAVPWSETHPIVLWIALGLAVVVLAWLAMRAMR